MLRPSTLRRIAAGIAVFSFLPYELAHWHANRFNWTPLEFQAQLHPGAIRTPEFLVDVDARYILYLEIQRGKMDIQREECLLDVEFFHPEMCRTTPSVIDLTWKLWDGDQVVTDESTLQTWRAESAGGEGIRREIGRFEARRGVRYALEFFFKADPSELNQANPKIVAEAIQDWDGYAIELQLSFVFGIMAAILAIALFIGSRRGRPASMTKSSDFEW